MVRDVDDAKNLQANLEAEVADLKIRWDAMEAEQSESSADAQQAAPLLPDFSADVKVASSVRQESSADAQVPLA